MGDFVFNIAKGRVAEYYNRVQSNDPANSALIIVALKRGATTDATMKDIATLSSLLSSAPEVTNSGYARKTLTDADLTALTVDNTNDRMPCDIADQTWTAVAAGDNWTDLVICYDNDTTSGTDANIVPLTNHSFAITTDGTNITATVADFYRAS